MTTDSQFRKTFTIQVLPKSALPAFEEAWVTDVGNKQVTIRYAERAGYHPTGAPTLESTEIQDESLNSLSVAVTYTVPVEPSYT